MLFAIANIDLVAILGNLLDNAVRGADRSTARSISLATAYRNSYCVIIVSNSYEDELIMHGKDLVTTKEDRKFHGFGLEPFTEDRNYLSEKSGI